MKVQEYLNNAGMKIENADKEILESEVVSIQEEGDCVRLFVQAGFYCVAKFSEE